MLEGAEESEDGLKSQRPSRRKQALQVARPEMWPSSASQPNNARARAELLRIGAGWDSGGGSEDCVGLDGLASVRGFSQGGFRRNNSCSCIFDSSRVSGMDGSGGNSEAIAASD